MQSHFLNCIDFLDAQMDFHHLADIFPKAVFSFLDLFETFIISGYFGDITVLEQF